MNFILFCYQKKREKRNIKKSSVCKRCAKTEIKKKNISKNEKKTQNCDETRPI